MLKQTSLAGVLLSLLFGSTSAAQIIVDNGSADFSTGGAWTASTSTPGYYGSNYLHDGSAAVDTGKWAKWRPTFPSTGAYTVYARWAAASNRPNSVRYRVYHQGVVTDVFRNQQTSGGTWVSLGTYTFSAGNAESNRVTLDAGSAAGFVVADAVQFTSGTATPQPTTPPTTGVPRSAPYVDISLGSGSQVGVERGRGRIARASRSRSWSTAAARRRGRVASATCRTRCSRTARRVKSAIDSLTGAGRRVDHLVGRRRRLHPAAPAARRCRRRRCISRSSMPIRTSRARTSTSKAGSTTRWWRRRSRA